MPRRREADFSRIVAVAVNIKRLMASESRPRGIKQNLGGVPNLNALGNLGDDAFLQNLLGLVVDARLDSSKATVSATLLCNKYPAGIDDFRPKAPLFHPLRFAIILSVERRNSFVRDWRPYRVLALLVLLQ